jgi:hypothetical protein
VSCAERPFCSRRSVGLTVPPAFAELKEPAAVLSRTSALPNAVIMARMGSTPSLFERLSSPGEPELSRAVILADCLAEAVKVPRKSPPKLDRVFLAQYVDHLLADTDALAGDEKKLAQLWVIIQHVKAMGGLVALSGYRTERSILGRLKFDEIFAIYEVVSYLCRYRVAFPSHSVGAEKRRGRAISRPVPEARNTINDALRFVSDVANRRASAPNRLPRAWHSAQAPRTIESYWLKRKHQAPFIFAAGRQTGRILVSYVMRRSTPKLSDLVLNLLRGEGAQRFLSDAAFAANVLANSGLRNFKRRKYPPTVFSPPRLRPFSSAELEIIRSLGEDDDGGRHYSASMVR